MGGSNACTQLWEIFMIELCMLQSCKKSICIFYYCIPERFFSIVDCSIKKYNSGKKIGMLIHLIMLRKKNLDGSDFFFYIGSVDFFQFWSINEYVNFSSLFMWKIIKECQKLFFNWVYWIYICRRREKEGKGSKIDRFVYYKYRETKITNPFEKIAWDLHLK